MQNTGDTTKRSHKKLVLVAVSALLALCVILLYVGDCVGGFGWSRLYSAFGLTEDLNASLTLSFLSVGKADCCVVTSADTTIIIDTGLSNTSEVLTNFLNRHKIAKVDALILSHADKDHIGGASDVLNSFEVESVYMPKIPKSQVPSSNEYENLYNSLEENKLDVQNPKLGDILTFGNITIDFIMPNKNYDDINDNSLVFRLSCNGTTALFTGDISTEVEEDLLNSDVELKSDVLKVAHHGSKTSSGEEFLNAVSPQIAVVCSGKSNYNLPDYTTMARLSEYCDSLYCTADDKTVVINCNEKLLTVQTGL